jgi:asparagine synthase (glutamine-hydrolysing)
LFDYPDWIRQDPARTTFSTLLSSPDALYRNYVPAKRVINTFEAHLNGSDHTEQLCRYLTLELWLQQVFEGRWRQGPEKASE